MLYAVFDAARVALTLVILFYASWSDYKTREVSDKVWAIYAPLALTFSLPTLLYDPSYLELFGLSIGITVGFALLLFYIGGFGGADSKAFTCMAVALPFFPASLLTPILSEGLSPLSQTIFPLTVLSNSVLIAALSSFYLLFSNIIHRATTGQPFFEGSLSAESIGKKFLTLITGQKVSLDDLKAKWHIYPIEDVTEVYGSGALKRRLIIIPRDEGRDKIVERLSNAFNDGKITHNVWATPGLPMLIFVTFGLVFALLLGDIIWLLFVYLFG